MSFVCDECGIAWWF